MKDFSRRNYKKLTEENVLVIKALLKGGATTTSLAQEFKVCRATISRIANNRMWEDIK